MNFSFAGCGFLGIYHVGVASCLRQHAPHLIENCKFAGASAGAIVACTLISGCCLGDCTTFTLRLATKARSFSIGPLHPSFKIVKILREALREVLPDNAHEIATGKLFISLTRVSDQKNVIVSDYNSKEELIQALMCSAHVPLYSGLVPPTFRGVRYVDGGLSDNIPALNDETISISPFAGESDICPSDNAANPLHIFLANTSMQCSMENLYRMSRALFPPHPEILSDMCQQGFDDCLKYLQNNKLLSCVRHLTIRSIITPVPVNDEPEEEKEVCEEHACYDCKKKRQVALLDKLPQKVGSALQDAIDDMNSGVKGYIYRHRSLRLLSFLATPWFLPVDISYTYAMRFLEYLPRLPRDVQIMYRETADLLRYLVTNIRHQRRRYTARFTCQLAITEVNYNQIDTDIYPQSTPQQSHVIHHPVPPNYRNLNFAFAMDLDSDITNHTSAVAVGSVPEGLHRLDQPHIDAVRLIRQHRPRSDSASGRLNSPGAYKTKVAKVKDDTENNGDIYDTFEQCLHVTNQMESIMAYHYRDENNEGCYMLEEIFTFREGEIDFSSLLDKSDEKATDQGHARSLSLGQCHMKEDLEEFVGQRSEVIIKEHEHEVHEEVESHVEAEPS